MPAYRVDRPRQPGVWSPGAILGLILIAVWIGWWVVNVRRDVMVLGDRTWVPPLSFLAGDFKVHIDHVARLQAKGVNPYTQANDWVCALYPYPPMIGRLFAWVAWLEPGTAAATWQAMQAFCLIAGGLAVARVRTRLGLRAIPAPLIVAAVLFSTPALFALERGQSDPVVILPLIASAWLLGRREARADYAAGAILGLTAWMKYYPGLAILVPLALGRWRAVAAFAVVAAAIGVIDRDGFVASVQHGRVTAGVMADKVRHIHATKHSLVESWSAFGVVHRSRVLRSVPGALAAFLLLAPVVVLVSRRVARAVDPGPLLLPWMFWLVAAATFAMPYSIDYNLVSLPLAALAVADRRDGRVSRVVLALSLVCWQPFALPIGGAWLLVLKLGALYAVGASLARRASEGVLMDQVVRPKPRVRLVPEAPAGYAR